MNQTDPDRFFKKDLYHWSRAALISALLFEGIVLLHLFLFLRTGNSYGALLSVELLYILAWVGFSLHRNIHEFLGRRFIMFAITILVVPYEIVKRLLLNVLEFRVLNALPYLHLTLMEATFVCMLSAVLFTCIKARKRQDQEI